MTRPVAGLDGCPDGWVVVTEDGDGVLSTRVACSFADALWHLPDDAIVAVDTPIGLTDAGQRECDRAARKLLRMPRRCSVFSSPVRGVLGIRDYRTASDARRMRAAHGDLRIGRTHDPGVAHGVLARDRDPATCACPDDLSEWSIAMTE